MADFPVRNTNYGSQYNENYFARLIFGGEYNGFTNEIIFNSNYNSLKKYYSEISYQQLSLTGNITHITLNHSLQRYAEDGDDVDNANVSYYQIIKDALEEVDNEINIEGYDADGDGWIDHPFIICATSNEAEYYSTTYEQDHNIWPKRVYFIDDPIYLSGGKKGGWGVIVTADSPVGIMAHEFFHDIGAPDLYDPDEGSYIFPDENDYPVGYWCLMSMGAWCYSSGMTPGELPSHPLGYLKWKMGWLTPYELTGIMKNISINFIEKYNSDCLYKITVSDTDGKEYFLIENRYPYSGYNFYDRDILPEIKRDSGLLIYHIDENYITTYGDMLYAYNWGTPIFNHYFLLVLDHSPSYNGIYDERKIDAAFSLEDNATELTPYTTPVNTASYYNTDSQIYIKDISHSGEIMTFSAIIGSASPGGRISNAISYPSPLKGNRLTVKFNSDTGSESATLYIMNLDGIIVYEKPIIIYPDENIIEINLPDIPPGLYFIQIVGEHKSVKFSKTMKIIKY